MLIRTIENVNSKKQITSDNKSNGIKIDESDNLIQKIFLNNLLKSNIIYL